MGVWTRLIFPAISSGKLSAAFKRQINRKVPGFYAQSLAFRSLRIDDRADRPSSVSGVLRRHSEEDGTKPIGRGC